jgi:hypothetical protein
VEDEQDVGDGIEAFGAGLSLSMYTGPGVEKNGDGGLDRVLSMAVVDPTKVSDSV